MRILKRVCFVLLLAVMPLLMAQTGPTVFTPRLTVSPGPLTVTTDDTTVQDLIILGTCTGCVGSAAFSNPTATIGLTAVNGVAATGIRSDGAPALSQAIVPTWSGFHTFTALGTTSLNTYPLKLQNSAVRLGFTETDATLDNGRWDLSASGEALSWRAVDDAGIAPVTFWQVQRTGTLVDAINLTATAVTVNGQNVCRADGTGCPADPAGANPTATIDLTAVNGVATTFMRSDAAPPLSQAITPLWTGLHSFTLSRTNATPSLLINSTVPGLRWDETDAAANNRLWELTASAEAFRIGSILNDAGTLQATAIQVDRTAGTIDSIALAATAVTVNGQNVCRADGTGCPSSFSGLANPTATIGLTAVNGSATTALRSDGAPALSQAIIPTWTGAHTWTANMNQTKADPRFCQYDSGSDATWFWRMSGDVLRLNIVDGTTCTTTGASAPFAITSAAGTVSAIGITSTALTWNGLDMVNTGSAPTWTGQHVFSNSSGAVNLNSVNPALQWTESDQGADGKLWNLIASSGSLQFQTRTDAGGAGAVPISMTRSGTTVTSIALTATAATVNGSNICRADGTGCNTTGAANPTGTIGLTAVNGSATTYLRSDGAPALSQAIVPTWTGLHTFDGGGVTVDDGGVRETACSLTLTGGGTFNNLDVFATCSPSGAHAILRITPDATLDSTITGMVLANNQKVTVVIPSPGSGLRAVILNNESGSSTATNRLILPSESNQCTLNRGDSFVMWKDPTSDRVRIMNGDGYVCGA